MSGTDPTLGRDPDFDVHAYATRDAAVRAGAGAHARQPSVEVDVAIRQLLDQQADIQARLASLIAGTHRRLDPALELDMLRHKVRILESLVDRHGLAPAVPILSELEEARLLQYRSECLEAACIQHNLDVAEPLRLSVDGAPPGFAPWLDRNLDIHDPILRSARVRDEHAHAAVPSPHRMSSFKCWDERCMHYIYGFATQLDRDNHASLHSSLSKRDSGLSMGTAAPTPVLPDAPESLRYFQPGPPTRPAVPSSLPPLSLPPQQPRERRDSAVTYTFPSARPGAGRGSIDSDVDPLLPPLKRSRVGRPRLESIGELKLFRDDNPCLRCRAANQECDANQPCTNCLEQPPTGLDEFWGSLGCYRASIPSFVDIFLPGPLSPRQTRTPITPLAQRRTVNEYLQRAYPHLGAVAPAVSASLDFQDGFWWSGQLEQRHVVSANLNDYGQDMASQAPPILCVIASSWNAQDTSCSLLDLLGVSGCLSLNREAEEASYPVLYHAKVLLREVAFFGILQPDPVFRLDTSEAYRPPPEDVDFEDHVRLLHECMIRFLQSLEGHVFRSTPARPREWLAIFYSLCIFSAVKSLLFGIAEASPQNRTVARHYLGFGAGDPRRAMHAAYKALVRLFVSSGPMLLDGGSDLSPEEGGFYGTTSQVLRRDTWAARGLGSSGDFLMGLGESSTEWPVVNGFLRERRTSHVGDDVLVLPPILKPGHAPKRSAPSIQPPSDLFGTRAETAEAESLAEPTDLGTPALVEHNRARRHTVAEGAGYMQSPGHSFGSPIAPSRFKPTYQRPPLRRVFCNKCIEHPEGFRGEHELRRHTDAKHAALVKRWVCSEPEGQRSPSPQPVVPLSKCKACLTRKHYGAYYNAAAHLRRAHFNPHRGGKASGDWPPMTILKDWMREVRQPIDVPDNDSSSGDDEELKHAAEYYAAHGTGQSSGADTPMLAPGPGPPAGQIFASPTETGGSSTWGGVGGGGGGGGGTATGTATGTSTGMASPTSRNATENRSRCPIPDCGRVFKDLAAHMLTHQEERPEKCPIVSCEYHLKGFARKYDKNRHALTHYRGTMACPFCPGAGTPFEKAFNRADVFKRHLTSVHNVEQTPPNTRKVPASEMVASTGAQCSICHNRFAAAQDFYEHLDECVLNTITPSGSKPPSLYSHELDQLRQAQQQQQQRPPGQASHLEQGSYQPHEGVPVEAPYPTTRRDDAGDVGTGDEAYGHREDRMVVD